MYYANSGNPGTAISNTSRMTEPVATPSAMNEVNKLESRLADIHTALDALQQRLGVILRPEAPEADGAAAGNPVGMADLTLMVRSMVYSAEAVTRRLSSLTNRVEL
jgi:hypothetical protein